MNNELYSVYQSSYQRAASNKGGEFNPAIQHHQLDYSNPQMLSTEFVPNHHHPQQQQQQQQQQQPQQQPQQQQQQAWLASGGYSGDVVVGDFAGSSGGGVISGAPYVPPRSEQPLYACGGVSGLYQPPPSQTGADHAAMFFEQPFEHFSGSSAEMMRPPPPQYPAEMIARQNNGEWQPPPEQFSRIKMESNSVSSNGSSNGYNVDDALKVMENHANGATLSSQTPPFEGDGGAMSPNLPVISPNPGGVANGINSVKSNDGYAALSPAETSTTLDSPTQETDGATMNLGSGTGGGRKRKATTSSSTVSSSSSNRGGKRKKSTSEEHLPPEVRAQKEKERRFSNNTRERMRIRDINDALNELGRICMNLRPKQYAATIPNSDKPQTKLGVLNLAVEVITSLEQKVRERNINPSTVCLQRGGPAAVMNVANSPSSPTAATTPPAPAATQLR